MTGPWRTAVTMAIGALVLAGTWAGMQASVSALHVRATRADLCGEIVWLGYELEEPRERVWWFIPDDGHTVAQAEHPDGTWHRVASTPGGENVLRVPARLLVVGQPVRAHHEQSGWTSSPVLVERRCPTT
jgi:hypothetical protein